MRILILIPGLILTLFGAVFALQGVELLPTTFMRGPTWVIIGGTLFVVGLGLDVLSARRSAAPKSVSPTP